MNAALIWTGIALVAVLVIHIRHFGRRLRRLELASGAVMQGAAPSSVVRQLAQEPGGRVDAIRAYREETGADTRVAIAVVQALKAARP